MWRVVHRPGEPCRHRARSTGQVNPADKARGPRGAAAAEGPKAFQVSACVRGFWGYFISMFGGAAGPGVGREEGLCILKSN